LHYFITAYPVVKVFLHCIYHILPKLLDIFLDNSSISDKIYLIFLAFLLYYFTRNMKPKLKDVAKKAGVSITTASMALSGKGRISEEVRINVTKAARELGYTRKHPAEKKTADSSHTVGIFISIDYEWVFIWHFIRPIIVEIESNLKNDRKNITLIPIHRTSSDEEIIRKVIESRVEAIISIHLGNENLMSRLEQLEIPTILVMNGNFQDKFYSVLVDDIQCAYEGTMHLIGLGHRNIAYAECDRPDLPVLLNDRCFGFRKAIEEAQIKVPGDNYIRFDLNDIDELEKKLSNLFSKPNRPTAIFCLDDDIALRVITVLSGMGIKTPEDYSIIAPGDVLDYNLNHIPKITTMKINTTYMGKIVYQMLMNRLEHKPEDLHVLKVKHQLVRRGTCKEL